MKRKFSVLLLNGVGGQILFVTDNKTTQVAAESSARAEARRLRKAQSIEAMEMITLEHNNMIHGELI